MYPIHCRRIARSIYAEYGPMARHMPDGELRDAAICEANVQGTPADIDANELHTIRGMISQCCLVGAQSHRECIVTALSIGIIGFATGVAIGLAIV